MSRPRFAGRDFVGTGYPALIWNQSPDIVNVG